MALLLGSEPQRILEPPPQPRCKVMGEAPQVRTRSTLSLRSGRRAIQVGASGGPSGNPGG
eukprot:3579656-Pyramimonas_sp.AAC.1